MYRRCACGSKSHSEAAGLAATLLRSHRRWASGATVRAGAGVQAAPIAQLGTPGSSWGGGGRFLAGGAAPPSGHAAALIGLTCMSSAALVSEHASRESQTWAMVMSMK